MRILIVDDERLARAVIHLALKKAGYEAIEADSAAAALEVLGGDRSDVVLVITDFRMPETDGLQLIAQIRADPVISSLPVLVCTAVADRDTVMRASRLNVSGYLLKPVGHEQLNHRVRQLIGARTQTLDDLRSALRHLGVTEDVFAEMFLGLRDEIVARAGQLIELAIREDSEQLRALLEPLSRSAASLGAARALNVIVEQLLAARQADFERIVELTAALKHEATLLPQMERQLAGKPV